MPSHSTHPPARQPTPRYQHLAWLRAGLGAVLLAALLLGCSEPGDADATPLRVGVAANFAEPMRALAERYTAISGQAIELSVGSTGALFSQIEHGAPFDLLLAADARRPTLIAEQGLGVAASQRCYARGTLVLWQPKGTAPTSLAALTTGEHRIAIANPATAPYGAAAQAALEHAGVLTAVEGRLVRGQSIGQTYQFVASGAAPVGLVAQSQVLQAMPGSVTTIDPATYPPIDQHGILIRDSAAGRALWRWLTTDPEALALIRASGYQTPEAR